MIQITIDGQPITAPEGRTVLEVCREHDIYVPTLCYHPALEPWGGCRLCMVELSIGGRPPRLVAACTHPAEDGLLVRTNSEAVRRSRRVTAELLLAGAYDVPEIVALAESLGVSQLRYQLPEADACVLCGLCVRACQEIVGVSAISMINRGINKQVSPPLERASASCIGCGTCVLICPTGKIKLDDITLEHSKHRVNGTPQPFYCQLCADEYQIRANGAGG